MQEVDLLIFGSGLAGLSTALHLLLRDTSWGEGMLVVEKAAHLSISYMSLNSGIN